MAAAERPPSNSNLLNGPPAFAPCGPFSFCRRRHLATPPRTERARASISGNETAVAPSLVPTLLSGALEAAYTSIMRVLSCLALVGSLVAFGLPACSSSDSAAPGGGGSGGVEVDASSDAPVDSTDDGFDGFDGFDGYTFTCDNHTLDGAESDVDCGSDDPACPRCDDGKKCDNSSSCVHGTCISGICASPGCSNGILDGFETDADCGGPDATCGRCAGGLLCKADTDCLSALCGCDHDADGGCNGPGRCTAVDDGGTDAADDALGSDAADDAVGSDAADDAVSSDAAADAAILDASAD